MITGCSNKETPPNVSVFLEIINKADCINLCYQLKVTIKNNTNRRIYISKIHIPNHIFVIDSSGCNAFNNYLKDEIDYYKEHITPKLINSELVEFDGTKELVFDINQISQKRKKKNYHLFTQEAMNFEMNLLIKRNRQLFSNTKAQEYIKDYLFSKYAQIILLEPNSEEYELYNINTIYNSKKEVSIFFSYQVSNSPHVVKIKIPDGNEIIEMEEDCLINANGYLLFTGKLSSDTLIIKHY